MLWKTLLLVFVASLPAQSTPNKSVAVSFSIDGSPAHCEDFQVVLTLNGESIQPSVKGQSFEIPGEFKRPASQWRDDQRVDISLTCSGHTLVFPNQHPAFIREGDWRLGIAYPLYALKEYGYTHEFDHGTWLSYLIFEGEPGVFTLRSKPDPPAGMADSLLKEQPTASPARARDLAYELAVLSVDYGKNRDLLLSLLNNCLSRPKESPEDDVCDSNLLSFVTNLYWRGDTALLAPLLQIAEPRGDVIGDVGTFYSDLLDGRGAVALNAIEEFPDDRQKLVCRLAGDDLRFGSPKRNRVLAFLRGVKTSTATRCLSALND
jgi:hypothetical protein